MPREYQDTSLVFGQIAERMRFPLTIVNFGAECLLELIWRKECMGVEGGHGCWWVPQTCGELRVGTGTFVFQTGQVTVAPSFRGGIY